MRASSRDIGGRFPRCHPANGRSKRSSRGRFSKHQWTPRQFDHDGIEYDRTSIGDSTITAGQARSPGQRHPQVAETNSRSPGGFRPSTDRDMKTTSLLSSASSGSSCHARQLFRRQVLAPITPEKVRAAPSVSRPVQLQAARHGSPDSYRPARINSRMGAGNVAGRFPAASARQAANPAPISGPAAAQSAATPNLILPTDSQNAHPTRCPPPR